MFKSRRKEESTRVCWHRRTSRNPSGIRPRDIIGFVFLLPSWPCALMMLARKTLIYGQRRLCCMQGKVIKSFLSSETPLLMSVTAYDDGRSKQASFPFVRQVTVDVIAHAGVKLWNEIIGTNKTVVVNYISLAFTGIDIAEQGQKTIEGFLKPNSISTPNKRPRIEESSNSAGPDIVTVDDNDEEDVLPEVQPHEKGPKFSWTCSRCGKEFQLPNHMSYADDATQRMALSIDQSEHEDFHLAEDLSKDPGDRVSGPKTPRMKPGTAKKRSRKEPRGLDKYFLKK